jgi:aminoglycoside phosphotransferase (APT) family kinase protein
MISSVTAFEGSRRIATGPLAQVAAEAKAVLDRDGAARVLIFHDHTSALIEVDFRGSPEQVRARLESEEPAEAPRRGRPKLGVTAREVTLLPRHWDWLGRQPGAASATLRRLIDQARREDVGAEAMREARDALYRFATAMAGDAPGYEAALRALFAGDSQAFILATRSWPADVRDHAWRLAPPAFGFPPSPLDAAIPFERRAAVQAALETGFPGAEVLAAAPVSGGASGAQVFRLTIGGADRLLRLEGPRDALRDPARQHACMRIAAEAGVAPRLIHADAESGTAITDFIHPSPADAMSRHDKLQALASGVATLHAAPLFPGLIDIFDGVGAVIAQAGRTGALPSAGMELMTGLFEDLTRRYPSAPGDVVSSHNDLNPGNVLFRDGRAWFVDWESAFAADRYMDLAAATNFFATDPDDEELILQTYFGPALEDRHRAQLFLMQQLNRLFYSAVLLNAAVAAQPDLRLTAQDLRTPRFGEIRGEAAAMATQAGRARFACAFLKEAAHAFETPRLAWASAQLRA